MSVLFKSFALSLFFTLLPACGTKQPKVEDQGLTNAAKSIDHTSLTTNCAECHEAERPPPNTDLNATQKHGLGADCSNCHDFPTFPTIKKAAVLGHNPAPTVCLGCHTRASTQSTHEARGECAPCHKFPNWKPG